MVAVGTSPAAYMQFEYQLIDTYNLTWITSIFSGSIFIYLLIIGLAMMLGIWFLLKTLFQSNAIFWKSTA